MPEPERVVIASRGVPPWPLSTDGSEQVVVNESLARAAWPGKPAVGRQFTAGASRIVVGVVADLRGLDPTRQVLPTFFDVGSGSLLLTRIGPGSRERLEALVQAVDADARIRMTPLTQSVDRALQGPRVVATFGWIIGLTALLIAATGVFALLRMTIAQRRHELGIRCALGATARHIVTVVVGESVSPVIVGFALGLMLAMAAVPVLRVFIVNVQSADPRAFLTAAAIIGLALLTAVSGPVSNALRVNPADVLRSD